MAHLLFEPLYQQRVWGGRAFAGILGRALPPDLRIGESWELVDRPDAMSRTADGRTLRSLIEKETEAIMGPGWDPARPFPILVKWLDCRETLSLQVHPPEEVASQLGGEPKTEHWFVAAAKADALLMAGLKQGVTREEFEAAIGSHDIEGLVHHIAVQAGDSIFIPSGRLHAIGAGNLILEIQQNSDTTYRVHDWGRTGLDGQPRALHIEESLRSTDFGDFEPATLRPVGNDQLLVECEAFTLRRLQFEEGGSLSIPAGQPRILSVITGLLRAGDGTLLETSQNALLPAAENFRYEALEECELLLTEDFNR